MGLTEDLVALSALTDEQQAGIETLVAMSSKQQTAFAGKVQEAWDANLAAIRDANAAVADASRAYVEACDRYGEVFGPLRRKALLGQLTDAEADLIEAADKATIDAYDVKTQAVAELWDVQQRFKAGVTAEQVVG